MASLYVDKVESGLFCEHCRSDELFDQFVDLLIGQQGRSPTVNPTTVSTTTVNPTTVSTTTINPTTINPTTINPTTVNPTIEEWMFIEDARCRRVAYRSGVSTGVRELQNSCLRGVQQGLQFSNIVNCRFVEN